MAAHGEGRRGINEDLDRRTFGSWPVLVGIAALLAVLFGVAAALVGVIFGEAFRPTWSAVTVALATFGGVLLIARVVRRDLDDESVRRPQEN